MLSDWIAGGALIVSLVTFSWSRRAERRIRDAADRKSAFDAWLLTPLETHITEVSQLLSEMAWALHEFDDPKARTEAVRLRVRGRFTIWSLDISSFIESHSDDVLADVNQEMSTLVDTVSDQMNILTENSSEDELKTITKKLLDAKHTFTSNVRASLQSARLAVK